MPEEKNVRSKIINQSTIDLFDPDRNRICFFNINTRSDYLRALEIERKFCSPRIATESRSQITMGSWGEDKLFAFIGDRLLRRSKETLVNAMSHKLTSYIRVRRKLVGS